MSASSFTVTSDTTSCWNGPTCQTCGAKYLGSHTCSWDDLQKRIDELRAAQERLFAPKPPPGYGPLTSRSGA